MSRLEELKQQLAELRHEKALEIKEISDDIPEITPEFTTEELFDDLIKSFRKQKNDLYSLSCRNLSWERLCYILEGVFIDEPQYTGKVQKPRTAGKKQCLEQLEVLGLPQHCVKYITAKNDIYTIRLKDVPFERIKNIMNTIFLIDMKFEE